MVFPAKVKVSELSQKASEYVQYSEAWCAFSDLYRGGAVLQDAVAKRGLYLRKKPKELSEVFATRQLRFSYTNLLGNIVGWYAAAMFKDTPQLVKRIADAEGEEALNLPQEIADFCSGFENDCDRAGTPFVKFWTRAFEKLLLHQAAYVLIDLPAPGSDGIQPVTLQQQAATGLLNPYLVLYEPSQVINWETDAYGNLEWCVIAISAEEREFLQATKYVDYWYYFDRQQCAMYQAERKNGSHGQDAVAVLVEGYPRRHALSDQDRVPVRKVEVADGLWLANRVYLPLLNHLNLDNAFDFGLFQAALAQLVIKGPYEDNVTLSEVGYIHLPDPDSAAEYLEPEGRAFEAIDKRLQTLEERIYKSCYLMDQARTNRSTPTAQSGISKQQDKTPGRDALSGYGDVIRPAMQSVYADVLAVRGFGDRVVPDVRGFDFADKAGSDEMDFMEKSTVIDVQSDTYRRERDKRFVRLVLQDVNPETMDKIDSEIMANPTPEAAQQQQQEEQRAAQLSKFTASLRAGADQQISQ